MLTDWALVRRLAAEIESRLQRARVQDVGALPDGRPALLFWSRGTMSLLAIDAFGNPPLVTLEGGELGIEHEPGFLRAARPVLVTTTLLRVQSRRGDRLLRLSFGTRSRFGVSDELDLYIELVPRFGNAVLAKRGMVIAALKEFSHDRNHVRAVQAGLPYEMPPLPGDAPAVPRLIEQSGANAAEALAFLESAEALHESLYVYRRSGELIQAHLLPLPQLPEVVLSREPSLLDLLSEDRVRRVGAGKDAEIERRRVVVVRRISELQRKVTRELQALDVQRREVVQRESLREEGDRIYATLHELDSRGRDEAKERAVKLFARYRKLGSALSHIDARERTLRAQEESLETLRWEAERTLNDDLVDVELAFKAFEPRKNARAFFTGVKRSRKRRQPLERQTLSGSRILIGRSPSENADLTFRIARPNDLWFHTRGAPGAHVILQRDDRKEPPSEDIELAAALAAGHSKARESAKVSVDYVLRKHVRKRPDAPPGLVFYTKARTIIVKPALR